ncbi:DNA polymerase III subunit gamma/tau [Candidatus Peregrinibacteria bacterium]|nr:DNA polymerase III subunit gamma/tau [Candidatus Peregrinibacteria bacterium]
MSLYRKYRPKDFPSLIGQEHIKITLLNAVKAGQISHAYLFSGPRGTGKTTTARLLAKAINAEKMSEDGRFDGSELADEIDNGRLIDVIEIDAASNRGIDEMRDLREKINYSPTRAKNKVYIIDEVHMLTKEAFNALLKTLEEPPAFVYFILATTELHKVPETIISRCQRFDFRRIGDADLVSRMKFVANEEGYLVEEEALKIIAKQARGGLRDALSLFEQLLEGKKLETEKVSKILGISHFASIEKIYQLIESGDAAGGMDELSKLFNAGVDLVQFNKDFLDFLRGLLVARVKSADQAGAKKLIEMIEFFQLAYEKQRSSYIPELPLEIAVVKSAMQANSGQELKKKSDIVQPIKKVEQAQEKLATASDNEQKNASEIIPEKSEEGININSGENIDLNVVLDKWSQVLARVHHPLAKRCLMAGKAVDANGSVVTLAFSNNFNKDKLFVPELLSVVEKAFQEEFDREIKLQGKVDTTLVMEVKKDPSADIVESALNVFGGEVIG